MFTNVTAQCCNIQQEVFEFCTEFSVINRSNSADVRQKKKNNNNNKKNSSSNANYGVVVEIVECYYIIHFRVCTTF